MNMENKKQETTDALRILVADDHEVVRRGVRTLLEAEPGWTVCAEATTGREAVEAAKRLRPDIVILDISMPELNGLEAARQIRSAVPEAEIVILTIHESEEVIREVLATGARGYVLKSDAGRDLVTAIGTLRHGKPFLTPRVAELMLDGFIEGEKGAPGPGRRAGRLTRASASSFSSSPRAAATRRSPPSWGSASRPRRRTARTSCASSTSTPRASSCATPSATASSKRSPSQGAFYTKLPVPITSFGEWRSLRGARKIRSWPRMGIARWGWLSSPPRTRSSSRRPAC
jgi:DNA-binding NarL/FixJ family response regulator